MPVAKRPGGPASLRLVSKFPHPRPSICASPPGLDAGDVVEAGVDAISITAFTCPDVGDGDFDADGDVDLADFAGLQGCWTEVGLSPACAPGDLNGDDALDTVDLEIFTLILTGP